MAINFPNTSRRRAEGDEVPGAFNGFFDYVTDQMGSPEERAAQIQADSIKDAIPFLEPFYDAGLSGIEAFSDAATPQGLGDLIAQIMKGDYFVDLMGERERSVQGQLAAGGLTRSGAALEEAARIPTDLAFDIENILTGRQGSMGDIGYGAAQGIANLTTEVGEAIASGILGREASRRARDAARDSNRSNLFGSFVGGLGSALGGLSDPALKENVRVYGKVGPLTLVEWDWIPEAKGTIAELCPTIGFMAPEVKEHFPDLVSEFGGYQIIDYAGLTERLECHL